MEPDSTRPVRKVRFAPKVPVRKPVVKVEPKEEDIDDEILAETQRILRLNENTGRGRGRAKIEKKESQVQVAFGQGATSNPMRNYAKPKRESDGIGGSAPKMEKEYKEPWNYYSYYPVTVPLRPPDSGNPVHLDEAEFGEAASDMTYNEDTLNPAEDLGLAKEGEYPSLIFLQLPASLPLTKRSAAAESNETANNSKSSRPVGRPGRGCSLEELPPGFVGKILVYKSGKVKLKIGDTLYDVSPGSHFSFVNEVVAVNTDKKQCWSVGELTARAIVTPDVDSLLSAIDNM
ncbi:hypothetical protein C5167_017917 [Papaver somniferum]|uniref:DNA-directed RNA polymerase III subunit RPC4 n=1 Tax=Papaver somniferum TaxID=3469 RepID=A0A4Y7IP40_PAPSO|nr:uncharacterized protein LOC113353278 isoform X1 [Papaver somniferum]RZC49491.1 hypothetical protein C5167_017917 [Papaver somniferum]